MLIFRVISMGPSQAHEPSAGPAEANGLPEAHGLWAPGSLYPPAPLLGGPGHSATSTKTRRT